MDLKGKGNGGILNAGQVEMEKMRKGKEPPNKESRPDSSSFLFMLW